MVWDSVDSAANTTYTGPVRDDEGNDDGGTIDTTPIKTSSIALFGEEEEHLRYNTDQEVGDAAYRAFGYTGDNSSIKARNMLNGQEDPSSIFNNLPKNSFDIYGRTDLEYYNLKTSGTISEIDMTKNSQRLMGGFYYTSKKGGTKIFGHGSFTNTNTTMKLTPVIIPETPETPEMTRTNSKIKTRTDSEEGEGYDEPGYEYDESDYTYDESGDVDPDSGYDEGTDNVDGPISAKNNVNSYKVYLAVQQRFRNKDVMTLSMHLDKDGSTGTKTDSFAGSYILNSYNAGIKVNATKCELAGVKPV